MENTLSPCVCQYVVYHDMMSHVFASQLGLLVSICFHITDASTQHVYKHTFVHKPYCFRYKPNKKTNKHFRISLRTIFLFFFVCVFVLYIRRNLPDNRRYLLDDMRYLLDDRRYLLDDRRHLQMKLHANSALTQDGNYFREMFFLKKLLHLKL